MPHLPKSVLLSGLLIASGAIGFAMLGSLSRDLRRGDAPSPSSTEPAAASTQATLQHRAGEAPVIAAPSAELARRIAAARALPLPEARREALIQTLAETAEREPESAARLAIELSIAEGRDEALHEALGHFLRAQPQTARAWLDERAARADGELLLVLAREAALHGPQLGLKLAEQLPVQLRKSAIQDLFADWAGSAPEQAGLAALSLASTKDQRQAAAGVSATWAHSDPQAAWAWASAIGSDDVRRHALEPAIASWAESDPGAAARAAADAPLATRQRMLDVAASAWAKRDLGAALDWLKSLPSREEREGAATAALLELLQEDLGRPAEHAAAWTTREAATSRADCWTRCWRRSAHVRQATPPRGRTHGPRTHRCTRRSQPRPSSAGSSKTHTRPANGNAHTRGGRPMRTTLLLTIIALLAWRSPAAAHGDLHDQIVAVTAELKAHPRDAALHHKRGELHRAHGAYARALADYARAEQLDSSLHVVRLSRGRALLESKRPALAVEALSRFLDAEPAHEQAVLLRARANAQLTRRADAERDFATLFQSIADPMPDLFIERANNLEAMGELAAALTVIEEGRTRLGSLIVLEDAALQLEEALGRIDAAIARLDRLLSSAARKETLLARKAALLERAGRAAEAAHARTAALSAFRTLAVEKRKLPAMQKLERELQQAKR